jgi:hypothetical protein
VSVVDARTLGGTYGQRRFRGTIAPGVGADEPDVTEARMSNVSIG